MLLYNITILYIKIELYILKINHLLESLCFSMLNANSISWKSLKMTYMCICCEQDWLYTFIKMMPSTKITVVISYQYPSYCCAYMQRRGGIFIYTKTVNHLSDQQSYDNKCFTKCKHIWTFCEQFQKIFICVIVLWDIYYYSSQWENGS